MTPVVFSYILLFWAFGFLFYMFLSSISRMVTVVFFSCTDQTFTFHFEKYTCIPCLIHVKDFYKIENVQYCWTKNVLIISVWRTHARVCVCVCVHVCVCVYVCVCVCAWMHVWVPVHTHTCMHAWVCTGMCVCGHVCACQHICMHTHESCTHTVDVWDGCVLMCACVLLCMLIY